MIAAGPSDLPALVKMYYTETARVLPPNAPLAGLVVASGALAADAGPELRKLDWLVGRWAMEGQSRTASVLGPAGPSLLAMNCRWLVGGTNLFCTVNGMLPGGPYHDVMIHTYDPATRAFRGFDADSTGMAAPFGLTIGKDSWVYTYDLKIGGKPTRLPD